MVSWRNRALALHFAADLQRDTNVVSCRFTTYQKARRVRLVDKYFTSVPRYALTQILSQIVRAVAMSNALLCAWLTGDTRKIFVSDVRRRRVQLGARLGRL